MAGDGQIVHHLILGLLGVTVSGKILADPIVQRTRFAVLGKSTNLLSLDDVIPSRRQDVANQRVLVKLVALG